MAKEFTLYPDALDTSETLPKATDNVTPVRAEVVNRLREAVMAMQSELGINPSGTFTTVKHRLDVLEGTIKGELGQIGLPEVLATNNTTGGTSIVVSAGDAITGEGGVISLADTNRFINSADPQSAQDLATKAYVDAEILGAGGNQDLASVLDNGNDADNKKIVNLANPEATQDAATKNYVDSITIITPDEITTPQNNYNPTNFSNADIIRVSSNADQIITGLAASADMVAKKIFVNIGNYPIIFVKESAGSLEANRILLSTSFFMLFPNESVEFVYDNVANKWVLTTNKTNLVFFPIEVSTDRHDVGGEAEFASVLLLDASSHSEDFAVITGINYVQNAVQERKTLINIGSKKILLSNNDEGSNSENRFLSVSNNMGFILHPRESVEIQYVRASEKWLIIESKYNPIIDSAEPGATENNYEPVTGWHELDVMTLNPGVNSTITGFVFSGDSSKKTKVIVNTGSANITLAHQSASSTDVNRILSFSGSDVVLAPNESCSIFYDDIVNRWRILNISFSSDSLTLSGVLANGNQTNGNDIVISADDKIVGSGGIVSFDNDRLVNVADPEGAQDVVTKSYVDGYIGAEPFGDNDITPAEIISDQNNYNPTGIADADVVRLSSNDTITITGISSSEIFRKVKKIINIGDENIIFAHQSEGSTAANRIISFTEEDITLRPSDSMMVYYDETTSRWHVTNVSSSVIGFKDTILDVTETGVLLKTTDAPVSGTEGFEHIYTSELGVISYVDGYDNFHIIATREYVDTEVAGKTLSLSEVLAEGNTTGANSIDVSSGQRVNFLGDVNIADSGTVVIASTGGGSVLTLSTGGSPRITASSASISFNSHRLTSVTDPTDNQDAATKAYVDTEVAGKTLSLSEVLAEGNITDGTDIVLSIGDKLSSAGNSIDVDAKRLANVDRVTLNSGSWITYDSQIDLRISNTTALATAAGNILQLHAAVTNLQWQGAVSNPTLGQIATGVDSATGQPLTINAQNANGANSTGGKLVLASGTGTNADGDVEIKKGANIAIETDGDETKINAADGTGIISIDVDGMNVVSGKSIDFAGEVDIKRDGVSVINTASATQIQFRPGGSTRLFVLTSGPRVNSSLLDFVTAASSPTINQAQNTSNDASGSPFTVNAQDCTGTNSTGGDLLLRSGTGTNDAGEIQLGRGNAIILGTDDGYVNVGDSNGNEIITLLDDGAFIHNVNDDPDTPTGGGVLYVKDGALKYRGSSGTITTLGPA